jgi:hypothetical protein
MLEGSGSGSIPLTDGSGSGSRRPKNIRIRNTKSREFFESRQVAGSVLFRITICIGKPVVCRHQSEGELTPVTKSKSNLMANFKVNRKRSRASEERMSTPRQQNIRSVSV